MAKYIQGTITIKNGKVTNLKNVADTNTAVLGQGSLETILADLVKADGSSQVITNSTSPSQPTSPGCVPHSHSLTQINGYLPAGAMRSGHRVVLGSALIGGTHNDTLNRVTMLGQSLITGRSLRLVCYEAPLRGHLAASLIGIMRAGKVDAMQIFRRETRGIVNRFLLHQLSFPHCIDALGAAHLRLVTRLVGWDVEELRVLMLANNERVMAEMIRRSLGTDN